MKASSRMIAGALTGIIYLGLTAPMVQAETRITDDYIAIDFAAESFNSSDDRWILTDPSTGQTIDPVTGLALADPDPNHSDLANGNVYLELLPDIRVKHGDPLGPPTGFWGSPGTGPALEYEVDFPEAGRYYVHVRALSTGTEDNGIFVGLNNDWPASGLRMQWCTGGQGWSWSSRQRDSGHSGPCGLEKTIWLTVENPGINTVKFSAREDGFEMDHVMLIKDKTDNTKVCSPSNENDIQCANGSIDGVDSVADMFVSLESNRTNGVTGDIFEFTATLTNFDRFDDAENVALNIDAELGVLWELVDGDTRCTAQADEVVCEFGNVSPTESDTHIIVPIQLRALGVGSRALSAVVSTSSSETNTGNNTDDLTVSVEELIEYATVQTSATWARSIVRVLEPVELTISLNNTGTSDLENAVVRLEIPEDIEVTELPAECVGLGDLECSIGNVESEATSSTVIGFMSDIPGTHMLTMTTSADNLEEGSVAALLSLTVLPVDAEVEPVDSDNRSASEEGDGGGLLGWFALFLLLSVLLLRALRVSLSCSQMRAISGKIYCHID